MNVRVFMLVAMTALFGALWSSDQRFQDAQTVVARAARVRAQAQIRMAVSGAAAQRSVRLAPQTVRPANRPAMTAALDGARVREGEMLGVDAPFPGVAATEPTCVAQIDGMELAGLVEWGHSLAAQYEEQSCRLRWQVRQRIYFARRRMAVAMRRPLGWQSVALRTAIDLMRRIEVDARRADAVRQSDIR